MLAARSAGGKRRRRSFGEHAAVSEVLQFVGALAILVAYALGQLRVFDVRSYVYLGLNLVGALLLAVIAYVESLWGFLLLEGAWTATSVWGMAARLAEARLETS
jgi:hypothetical protein